MSGSEGPSKSEEGRGAAWRRLFASFDHDPQEAFAKLMKLRAKLIRFFESNRCAFADDLADETIDRLLRRLDDGTEVTKIDAFALGIARTLRFEELRKQARTRGTLDEMARQMPSRPSRPEPKAHCFEKCLEALDAPRRELILKYYHGDGRARIEQREKLARELNLDGVTLRNRALRLRRALERCVRKCMELPAKPGGTVTIRDWDAHSIESPEGEHEPD